MRAPSIQSRILASPPVQLTAWVSTAFFGYHFLRGEPVFWATVIVVAFLMNVIRADEQVQAYKAWKREWDAMSGIPPRAKGRPNFLVVALVAPSLLFLYYVWQHGGASALIGVSALTIAPLLVISLTLKLIRRAMRRKAAKIMPVTICVKRSWLPVPDIAGAYRQLPEHCHQVMRARRDDGAATGAGL